MTPELAAFALFALLFALCLAFDNREQGHVWRDDPLDTRRGRHEP